MDDDGCQAYYVNVDDNSIIMLNQAPAQTASLENWAKNCRSVKEDDNFLVCMRAFLC